MTIPLFLTVIRLVSSLTILPFLIFFLMPLHDIAAAQFMFVLFTFIALTDFLDGFLARRYKNETMLGKLLDPLADKCFVVGALLSLVAIDRLYFYWAFLVITRELLVTGLRFIAKQYKFNLDVSWVGKWKATFQYLYIIFVVGSPWTTEMAGSVNLECWFLALMLIFSLVSGMLYLRSFLNQWRKALQD